MNPNIQSVDIDNGVKYAFSKGTTQAVSDALEKLMISEKYKLEFGDKMKGAYGVGNEILRILFGALVKRHRYNFEIKEDGGTVSLLFTKDSLSKISGGVIGYKKNESEFKRLVELIKGLEV